MQVVGTGILPNIVLLLVGLIPSAVLRALLPPRILATLVLLVSVMMLAVSFQLWYINTHTHTVSHTHTHIHTHTCTRARARTHTHMFIYSYVYTCAGMEGFSVTLRGGSEARCSSHNSCLRLSPVQGFGVRAYGLVYLWLGTSSLVLWKHNTCLDLTPG